MIYYIFLLITQDPDQKEQTIDDYLYVRRKTSQIFMLMKKIFTHMIKYDINKINK
jgi:hypothetical protein